MRRGITGVGGGGHGQQAYPEEQPRLVCFGCFRSLLLLPRLRRAGGRRCEAGSSVVLADALRKSLVWSGAFLREVMGMQGPGEGTEGTTAHNSHGDTTGGSVEECQFWSKCRNSSEMLKSCLSSPLCLQERSQSSPSHGGSVAFSLGLEQRHRRGQGAPRDVAQAAALPGCVATSSSIPAAIPSALQQDSTARSPFPSTARLP